MSSKELVPFEEPGDEVEEEHVVYINNSDNGIVMNDQSRQMLTLNLYNYTLVRCDDPSVLGGEPTYRIVANTSEDDETTTATRSIEQGVVSTSMAVDMDDASQKVNHHVEADAHVEKSFEDREPALNFIKRAREDLKNGRKSRGGSGLPAAHILLTSPNFKLFIYNCKLCTFKCNAIKELTAHKKSGECTGKSKLSRGVVQLYTCKFCSYKTLSRPQLIRHENEKHTQTERIHETAAHTNNILFTEARKKKIQYR